MEKVIQDDDILEYALNNGVEATKAKFNLSRADIVALGYDGVLPIEVTLVAVWLDEFPNSILREGYHLWREDLLKEATLKYPTDDMYYERRNHIIRLAIDEILKNIPEGNKVENNDIKNTLDVIESFEKAENSKQNTKDVLDADLKALKIYLGLGYSVEDAKNAFYKVFGDKSEANKKRFERLSKYITDYDNNKK